jgi:hypothetical protein
MTLAAPTNALGTIAGTTSSSFGAIFSILGVPVSSAAMEGHLSPATTILREISPVNALSKHVLIVVAQQ